MPTASKKSVVYRAASQSQKSVEVRSPADAYKHFLADVERLAESEISICRADLPLCLHNVQLGIDSVLPQEARLRKEMPALNLDNLRSLPDLAAGLIYAADRVSGPASKAELSEKLIRLRKLREAMLHIAEGLALWGLVPGERVTAIRAGKGAIDAARDGIALEAFYREFAAVLQNKHPFSAADLKEIADLGNYLVRAITPDGGRQRPEVQSQATQTRNRFYSLLLKRHAELRKAGFYLFGETVDIHVPALGARAPGARKAPTSAPIPGSDQPPAAA